VSYAPELRTEAFELYLAGNSPAEIAAELARRHAGQDVPTAKTIEKWAYVPTDGKTWSERRYAAESAALADRTQNFIGAKVRIQAGLMELQAILLERALAQARDADPGSFSQEIFACVNATKTVLAMLDSSLAEEARQKDAIDALLEAVSRNVPGWETVEPRILADFRRLTAQRTAGQPQPQTAAPPPQPSEGMTR